MGIYVALLLALGALVAVLVYFFGPQGDSPPKSTISKAKASHGLIHVVARTDPGLKRKQNEDSLLALEEHSLFAVADGMGRQAAGEVASQLTVDTISEFFKKNSPASPEPPDLPPEARRLRDAALDANRVVFQKASEVDQYQGMGTTLVALHFSASLDKAAIVSAGDSRIYRMRNDELKQLTTDHTLGAAGIVGSNAALLSKAVGIEASLDLDVLIDAPLPGDLYLLCSDGLSRMVDHEGLTSVLKVGGSLEERAKELIDKANQAGGRDNVTVILVKVAPIGGAV